MLHQSEGTASLAYHHPRLVAAVQAHVNRSRRNNAECLRELTAAGDATRLEHFLDEHPFVDLERVPEKKAIRRLHLNNKTVHDTALQQAVCLGHVECAKLLLARGADVHQLSERGRVALQRAAGGGHTECVALLLEHGADVHGCKGTTSPIQQAAGGGHLECVRLLLRHGADPDGVGQKTSSPALTAAARSGHLECMRALLEAGAAVEGSDGYGPPLFSAAEHGHVECVDLLLEWGADVHRTRASGGNVLLRLAGFGHTDCLQRLLQRGVDPNVVDKYGDSPLHEATRSGVVECVRLLLQFDADANVLGCNGTTPLVNTVLGHRGKPRCTVLLLVHGADPFFSDGGTTIYQRAQYDNGGELDWGCSQILEDAMRAARQCSDTTYDVLTGRLQVPGVLARLIVDFALPSQSTPVV